MKFMKKILFIAILIASSGIQLVQAQQDFSTLYNEGVKKIGDQDYSGAVKLFTAAIAQRPDFAEAIFARGGAYLMMHKREEACADFRASYKLNWKPAEEYISIYCNPNSPGMHAKPREAK